ncbi:unnamed protein product [Cylindrotheca closterium]|uniref:FAD dependent oxidoreductase domain-containing protein n=1 Tax=Cylindrotheca closterium TaxID=2856 RepID=A0AAD2FHS9_9STRA|nr:unnamed protein product [Cylindrotheca closterium]
MPASKVLVVGSGAIGLRTSLELLRKKVSVILRSPRSPIDTSVCSQGAGGLWMPFHCDDPRTDRWAKETLDELYPIGKDDSKSLVELVPTLALHRNNHGPTTLDFTRNDYASGTGGASQLPAWSTDARLQFQHMTTEMLYWQNYINRLKIPPEQDILAAGYSYAWLFNPPIVDCPKMLETMLKEVESKGADVNVETGMEYESLEEIVDDAKSLGCDAVVNCTGLGARKLCNDQEMVGARGILLQYDRQDCVRTEDIAFREDGKDTNIMVEEGPWGSEEMPCYMITRGNTVVVGGSYLEGDTEQDIRDHERLRLLENARLMGIDTEKSSPVGEWTGFRPFRPTSRLEVDAKFSNEDMQIVHSYGYGGSGWTVYVGAAKEAARLLLES